MHDAKGRQLKVGDTVLIPARITAIYSGTDYCNATAASVLGRRPDGAPDTITVNTGVMLRAEDGDENDLSHAALNPQPSAPQPEAAAA